ncbi:leucyl/phenylalanyl-tRNA--protein transferase [Zooshikella ganghwensis]|uniref:leucyl/phenylalanyl-tRNA--protein transferase n=1 Tax=Zooshikella ganghwensis TaxID=202772 RepID=UPI0004110AC9|nr:leucyl/phenylalanyl-tRNA--protein transferase [Zooshikella ganghwensis]
MIRLPRLLPGQVYFPPVSQALKEPNGLLAMGGDLEASSLVRAYRQGVFPWFNEGEPILWWSPDPRLVLFPHAVHVSRSLQKTLNRKQFSFTFNQAFNEVITACAAPRTKQVGTWITPHMLSAYLTLHEQGIAHSIECWQGAQLVGGLYGVAIGRIFFGESMFSKVSDASKCTLVALARQLDAWQFGLIDCQVESDHLMRMGAETLSRESFLNYLERYCSIQGPEQWSMTVDI